MGNGKLKTLEAEQEILLKQMTDKQQKIIEEHDELVELQNQLVKNEGEIRSLRDLEKKE